MSLKHLKRKIQFMERRVLLKNPWYAIDFSLTFQLYSAVLFCNLILNGKADTRVFLFALFFCLFSIIIIMFLIELNL